VAVKKLVVPAGFPAAFSNQNFLRKAKLRKRLSPNEPIKTLTRTPIKRVLTLKGWVERLKIARSTG
jgi:hypothetical protein